jgi:methionine-rich copper-binding protein CopC
MDTGVFAPDGNGSFSYMTFAMDSSWKIDGNYIFEVQLRTLQSETTLFYDNTQYEIPSIPISGPEPKSELEYSTFSVSGFTKSQLQDVTLTVKTPDGANVVAVDQVTPDANGIFGTKFNTSNWKQDGMYTITVQQGESYEKISVNVKGGMTDENIKRIFFVNEISESESITGVATNNEKINLKISTTESIYDLDELVNISVKANNFSGTQKAAIDVTDPRGNTVILRSIDLSSGTEENIEFRLSENFKAGTYTATATISDNGKIITKQSYFKIKSQFNSFVISSVTVTNQQGNASTLEVEEMGFIKVNLKSNKSIATLVTVNLFDSELTSIGIGSVKTTLSSGESEIILSFMIPDDAAIGPADIYVNAFSDWPSSGGIPLTHEVLSVENIQ